MPASMESIYDWPRDYDLEHAGDDEDVGFYFDLVTALRPRRVMELGSGSGRVTMPLTRLAATLHFDLVGLDQSPQMLSAAQRKREGLHPAAAARVRFVEGDIREWHADEPFDLVIAPCSSLSHLLSLDDQIAAWRCAFSNLAPGGRFVADVATADLAACAVSMQVPPRVAVELDVDARDPVTNERLLRYRTLRYLAHEQRAQIRFLYDKFPEGEPGDRFVSDFDGHVYFPRELELLFRLTGFEVETRYGDYQRRPFAAASRQMIVIGRKRP
jgi:SAM-dependent methyltransferase